MEKNRFDRLPLSRFLIGNSRLSEQATTIIKASWRSPSRQRHQDHMKFPQYSLQSNINPAQENVKIGIEYLTQYFYTGKGYSFVNTAGSVLSSISI